MNEINKDRPAEMEKTDVETDSVQKIVSREEKEGKKKRGGCFKRLFSLLIIVIVAAAGIIYARGFLRRSFTVPVAGDMILKSGSYTGTADEKNATFKMKLDYESFAKVGWIKVPILPISVAVSEVTLNGKPVYLHAGNRWYEVITRRKRKGTIEAEFSMKVKEQEGVHSLCFDVPRTTATCAELKIKGKELDVNVENAQHKEVATHGENTIVKATCPPVNRISLNWQRARPELEEKDARLYSEANTVCSILEGILHCNTVVRYSILRAWINGLKLSIPEDVNILSVTGGRIRDWKIVNESGKRILQVEFSYKVQGSYELNLIYEKPINLDAGSLSIPAVYSLGAEREKGHIGIESLSSVEVSTGKTDTIVTIDVDELPAGLRTMTSRPLILGYKYVEEPYSLALNVKRHKGMSLLSMAADSALHTVVMTSDGRRLTRVFYSLRNNGNQFLPISLPDGSELWNVSIAGRAVKVMQADEKKLLIPLMDAARGSDYVGVEVVYAEDGSPPDEKGIGRAVIELPAIPNVPTIHLMCELYLPMDGKYRDKDFVSNARMVDRFSSIRSVGVPGAPVISSEKALRDMRAQAGRRFERKVKAAGGTPVSVKLPMDGKLFRFEKILVLEEKVKIEFKYQLRK